MCYKYWTQYSWAMARLMRSASWDVMQVTMCGRQFVKFIWVACSARDFSTATLRPSGIETASFFPGGIVVPLTRNSSTPGYFLQPFGLCARFKT